RSDGPNRKLKLYQAIIFFVDLKYFVNLEHKNYMRVVMVRPKSTFIDDDGNSI
ncbi:hypothetical protein Tsubulata_044714, partial [Turnera subulata]